MSSFPLNLNLLNHAKLLQVAVNAYTRLLQHQVEADISESVVVNAIHPGSRHSKISQESPLTPSDAAKVKHCLCIHATKHLT